MDADLLSAIGSISSAIVALGGSVIAVFAWKASQNSAKATETLTQIEKMRLHGEMLPQLEGRIETISAADNRFAVINLTLVGPQLLVRLDEISFELRAIHLIKRSGDSDRYYTESAWPLLIVANDIDSPPSKQTMLKGPILVGEARAILVEASPEFQGDLRDYDIIVPASLTCTRAGFETWTVPIRLDRIEDSARRLPGTPDD